MWVIALQWWPSVLAAVAAQVACGFLETALDVIPTDECEQDACNVVYDM